MTKNGRPTIFNEKLVATICTRISEGESLRGICRDEKMPASSTVFKWLIENDKFSEQYARAREAQADALFEDILAIADDGVNDTQVDGEGKVIVNHDHIQRSRLRVDARKWMAGKIAPKKYGDKVQAEVSGPDGGPIPFERIERVIVDPAKNAKD